MFKIINLEEINKRYSREMGNEVVTQVSTYVSKNLSQDYVFVRYMGPKFVIAFSGVDANGVAGFLNDMKEKVLEIVNEIRVAKELSAITQLHAEDNLRDDLEFTSFDLAELTVRIEDEFDIDIFEDGLVNTIGEVYSKLQK